MPNLITYEFFKGDINIPNTANVNDVARTELTALIARYEREFLSDVLGFELTNILPFEDDETELWYLVDGGQGYYNDDDSIHIKWWYGLADQTEKLHSPIAYYVYCKVLAHRAEQLTSVGVIAPQPEMATVVQFPMTYVNAWNRMVELLVKMHDYLLYKNKDFEDFILYYGFRVDPYTGNGSNAKYFKKINQFGL